MRHGGLLVLALAGCAARAPAPPVAQMTRVLPEPCSIRPVMVTSRDFFTAETRREIRRVNRELRERCAGRGIAP